ncbi:MAG: FHA domain-containing protein [Thermoleophilaceae bacterium]|nr:FHA domain-containing protein [Thermoleophilaceae bacterium]
MVRLDGERPTLRRSNVNDVVLEDPNVSRFHAEIVSSGDLVELRDLDSRCGTRLNGRPVKTAVSNERPGEKEACAAVLRWS